MVFLGLLSIFFGLYRVDNRYIFDWDQEDDAIKTMGMIENRKPLLIGQRVTHENSFFAGPYHFYFLLPFYGLMQGNPKAGLVALTIINMLTVVSGFLIISKFEGRKVGLISSVLFLINQSEISWSAMYLPLFGIWNWWAVNKLLESRKNIKWILPMWGFFGVSHIIASSIITTIITAWLISKDKKWKKKDLLIGILGGLMFLMPLLIFDIRHDFLNLKKVIEMLQGKTKIARQIWLPAVTYFKSLNLLGLKWLGQRVMVIERMLVIIVGVIGVYRIKDIGKKIVSIVWVVTPLVAMFLYKGGVSEYYFSIGLVMIIILLARELAKLNKLAMPILGILLVSNFLRLGQIDIKTSLYNKMEIAEYLVSQQRDPVFNVSYELPLGWDTGFGYLFKYLGKEPQNIDQGHLYTIMLDKDESKTGQTVARSGVYILKRR